jgi:serine/threonine protein phosphatase PrpC
MKCSNCGRENRNQAGFCAWCGALLKPSKPYAEQCPPPSGQPETVPERVQAAAQPVAPPEESPPSPPEQAQAPSPDEPPAPSEVVQDLDQGGELAPLHPGQVLSGRYEIVELIENGEQRRTYRAVDLCRCAACGYDDNTPDAEYCHECGATLDTPCYAMIVERVEHLPEQYDERFTEGEREYFVTAEPLPHREATTKFEADSSPLKLTWGKATDKGLQRDHNEDYAETWFYATGSGRTLGLFIVADGLGGQDSGEVASRMATDAVWESLRANVWEPIIRGEYLDPDTIKARLVEAIKQANQTVYDTRIPRNSTMSTTMTLALIVDRMAYIGNVGDSRTYLWNKSGLQRITKDHSLVQRLVDAGEITPEEVYSHPQRNLIYQSIGDHPRVEVDIYSDELAADDHLILCSDGLWEMVRDEGLEEVLLSEPDPQQACERLVQNANLAGGEDNISVIVVQATPA